jgi:hypothetical protein
MIVGACHEERMGIYDGWRAVRAARIDATSPQRKAEGQEGRARTSIAGTQLTVERCRAYEVSADGVWLSVQLMISGGWSDDFWIWSTATCLETVATL